MALVYVLGSIDAQIGMLGSLVSILAGLFVSYLKQEEDREQRQAALLKQLALPVALAADPALYEQYVGYCEALNVLAMQTDPILREIGLLKARSMRAEISSLADGTVVFTGTEAWRTVYEKLLRSLDIWEYQSVAWVRSKDYWQDLPGQQSLALNLEAMDRGLFIERIVILNDVLWPAGAMLPSEAIRPWVEEQHNHGLRVYLIRESQLASEPDLRVDMGIYGDRAVGFQELDERCRTIRFLLHFDSNQVQLAKGIWGRLVLFSTSYRELLDRIPPEE